MICSSVIYLNNGPMVKKKNLNMEVDKGEGFKPSHLHFKFVC